MKLHHLGALAAALLLAGCAAPNYTETNFATPQEVADVIDWECVGGGDDEAQIRDRIGKNGFAGLPCHDGAITLWNSDATRQEIQAKPFNALKPGWCQLDGGNWTVAGSQYLLEDAEKVIGGAKTCA